MTTRLPSDVRRLQIADAALALVAREGIAALTTSTLASAVGITPGALFRHYASLDAILEAVAARADELLRASLPSRELPPLERLDAFVVARLALARSERAIPRLVLSEQFTRALPEAARRKLRAGVRASRDFVRDTLTEARDQGLVRDDLPPEGLALVVLGTMQMSLLEPTIGRERTDVLGLLRTLLAPPPTVTPAQSSTRGPRRSRPR
ncbi:MAG: TetR/AcrR family transcriptional regulator [Sandaracinus sp.]|nr:TetR/AcrR family transcriptional regulator [Sandaracinus sp.]MCB9615926.1 TetR/AcrR family transcriptional regulator [Sandaracinus sp.]MCB9622855.1 TetR/AcrR family transcriptional regulator [Sandaracinus sp.]